MDFYAGRWTTGSERRGPLLILAALVATLTMAFAASAHATPNVAKAWGFNKQGELGNGTETESSDVPVAVSGLSGVTAISGAHSHSLALLENGTVMAWGDNGFGQLGNGTEANSDVPVAVSGLSEVTAISAGGKHSLALLKNGTVMAWGQNERGQLGNGNTERSNVPVAVSGLSEVTAIAAGNRFSLALLKNGTVMAWGTNERGELGNGTKGGESDVPVAVSGLSGVVAIAAGDEHSLALLSNTTVMAWGQNNRGQLGNGTETTSDVPVAVSGLSGVSAISGGAVHSLALGKGTVMAWGGNENGQLGDGTSTGPERCGEVITVACSKTPVAVSGLREVTAISAGGNHSLALLTGPVMAWGANGSGQLGDGTSTGPEPCEPTSCSTTPVAVCAAGPETPCLTGPFLSHVKGIAAGEDHSLAFGPPPSPLPELGRCVKVKQGTGEWLGNKCTNLPAVPGKGTYNWLKGPGGKPKFSATGEGLKSGESVSIETVGGKKHLITCQVAVIEGEYTGAKTEKETVLLIGCTSPATKQKCQTNPAPQKESEIEFSAEGTLGFIKSGETPSAGWDLKGVSAQITCGAFPETNITSDTLEGSVVASVRPQAAMVTEMSLVYKEVAGRQVPEFFEGEALDVLTSKFTTGTEMSTEQTGLKARETLTNEEPLEIKVKCFKEKVPCK